MSSLGSESLLTSLMKGELRAFSELGSSSRDGSFYFFSADTNFIIETILDEEYVFLKTLLRDYHEYMKKNPRSLLPRILSFNKIYIENPQLKAEHGSNRIPFLVKSNILKSNPDFKELATIPASADASIPSQTFASFTSSSEKIVISKADKDNLMEILTEDCAFLERKKLTGYYLSVAWKPKDPNDKLEESNQSVDWAGIKREINTVQGLIIPSADGLKLLVVGMDAILTPDE